MRNTFVFRSQKSFFNIGLSAGLIISLGLVSPASSSSNAIPKINATVDLLSPAHHIQMSIMHLDLDYIYDADPRQLNRNINQLVKRIQAVQPNTIFLQAYADPDGNGSAEEVYFSNPHIPLRLDLFKK